MRWVLLAAAALFFGLIAGAVMIFVVHDFSEPEAEQRADLVPLAPAPAPAAEASTTAYAPKPAAPSSLAMVAKLTPQEIGEAPAVSTAAQPPRAPEQEPDGSSLERSAQAFRDAIRSCEKGFRDLAESYTRKHASIQQYGRDWMSYPELRKLNNDYMRDHDPIAFLRGLAASPNFPKLLQKYAGDGAVRGFVAQSIAKAPVGAMGTSMGYISQDRQLDVFVKDVASKVGLPPQALVTVGATGTADRYVQDALKQVGPQQKR